MKINLGFNSKRFSRDMSFDNNTTYGFGEVQPLMCQYLSPDSDIKIGAKSLVRLSPLKYPSFARVHLELVSRFVPMTEVFAPFESLLSNIPFSDGSSTFVPSNVPCILSNVLTIFLLQNSFTSIYKYTDTGTDTPPTPIDVKDFPSYDSFIQKRLLGFSLSDNILSIGLPISGLVSLDSADMLIEFVDSSKNSYILAAHFKESAQRLRKIFVGCGYDCVTDTNHSRLTVSLLPLLAFYKAYFDTYYPQRFISFPNTSAFALIQYLSKVSDPVYNTQVRFVKPFNLCLSNFMSSLSECYYASEDDYISIHTSSPINQTESSNPSELVVIGNDKHPLNTSFSESDYGGLPHYIQDANITPTILDNVLLRSIRLFTNYVSKDSVIGQRMSAWVKQHFNADLSNQLFKDSNFVGRHSIPLNISDVFSTSDTASGTGSDATGEHLGAFAGKGIGFGDLSFNFHSSVHGYLFVFACIVPESRTCQGTDPTLLALDRYSFPTPEFDALGFELTDRRVFIPSNDILPSAYIYADEPLAFGYVPRYTGFKYRRNIANGDMSRRSTRDTLNPYFLDRLIENNFLDDTDSRIRSNNIPSASPNWRFITRYGYLGHFNRLFYNDADLSPDYKYNIQMDNFISQTIFNVRITDFLKPLKSSYDTVSEDDNNVKPVTSE